MGRHGAKVKAGKVLSDVPVESEARLGALLKDTIAGVYIVQDGLVVFANTRMAEIFGHAPDGFADRVKLMDLVYPDDRDMVAGNIKRRMEGAAEPAHYFFRGLTADSRIIELEECGSSATSYCGRPALIGMLLDVTEKSRAEKFLKENEMLLAHLSRHDPLTDLPNRLLFDGRLERALDSARRDAHQAAVMILDLDRFKTVNDTLGHFAGDQLLEQVAGRLSGCIGMDKTLARLGGDEFGIVVPYIKGPEEASRLAVRIIKSMKPPFEIEGREQYMTVSIGIAVFPSDGCDPMQLMKDADTALNRAKEQGRNVYRVFDEAMNMASIERMDIESGLHRALERGEFIVHYQPLVNLGDGAVSGVEALVRWQHPKKGLVAPGLFIPVAEEAGLIVPIGEMVLRSACRQNMAWERAGCPPVRVAVNLSARQFQQPNLVETVMRALRDSGMPPERLELEITESTLMKNVEGTSKSLRSLSAQGIRISVDDFGTGYSSLGYIKKFPLHVLKVDQSFVREITTDPDDAAITTAIVAMAHSLGLEVVAEGVETVQQLEFLRGLDCDVVQGYLFSRPVPAVEIEKLLSGECRQAA